MMAKTLGKTESSDEYKANYSFPFY